jgi:hypothetical protein
MIEAGRLMSTEHKWLIRVGLSAGHLILQLGCASYQRFPLPVRFETFKSPNISKTARAGQGVSKEHQYETEVSLSVGQVVSARWRRLPPISAKDLFSRLLQTLITPKRLELSIDFSSKTAKIIVKELK